MPYRTVGMCRSDEEAEPIRARGLKYFDEVVRRGSIRKADAHLHVAPTAVNRQILELEAALGAPLLDRIN